jgi:asparagine synthase (glutamine-hydrolysing)
MSGIAGIFYRNNKPVQLEQLQAMGSALAHRGPDGINYYCKDSIGLVHCMLHDTPESLLERLPSKTDDERFVITFHGRIDNRQELYNKIGWIKPISIVTDSDLVLAAYQKWRKECVSYLLGDFAFAIWDQVEQKLFCARDHMGIKPFYYYSREAFFVFSSEIKGILVNTEIVRELNEERVADYFTSIVLDKESTFFKNILRLPSGNYLEVSSGRTRVSPYHILTPTVLSCKTDAEYEEQFREIFVDAVRVRLRSAFPVGSYLSGGLDSASIVCIAAELYRSQLPGSLQTFSGVFNEVTTCDEKRYFSSVVERYGINSTMLSIDNINPVHAYEKLLKSEDEPFWAPHIFMSNGLLQLVREKGVRVLLDGHDGDAAVSYGYSLFSELAKAFDLIQLVQCYKENRTISAATIAKKIIQLYWSIFCNATLGCFSSSRAKADVEKRIGGLNSNFSLKVKAYARLVNGLKSLPRFGQPEAIYHMKNISQPVHSYALEFLDRLTINENVVARYPFFDKRIIEFCLALPTEQKMRNGMNRSIVRRALGTLLPDSIALRKDKTDFFPSLLYAFSNKDRGWLKENVGNLCRLIFQYVDEFDFLKTNDAYFNQNIGDRQHCLLQLLKLVAFSRWVCDKQSTIKSNLERC